MDEGLVGKLGNKNYINNKVIASLTCRLLNWSYKLGGLNTPCIQGLIEDAVVLPLVAVVTPTRHLLSSLAWEGAGLQVAKILVVGSRNHGKKFYSYSALHFICAMLSTRLESG